jgi:hypothetical protein
MTSGFRRAHRWVLWSAAAACGVLGVGCADKSGYVTNESALASGFFLHSYASHKPMDKKLVDNWNKGLDENATHTKAAQQRHPQPNPWVAQQPAMKPHPHVPAQAVAKPVYPMPPKRVAVCPP